MENPSCGESIVNIFLGGELLKQIQGYGPEGKLEVTLRESWGFAIAKRLMLCPWAWRNHWDAGRKLRCFSSFLSDN